MSFLYSFKVNKVEEKKLNLKFYVTNPDCLAWGQKSVVMFNPDFFALIVLVDQNYDDEFDAEVDPEFELQKDKALIKKVIKSAVVCNRMNYPPPEYAFDYTDDNEGYNKYWSINKENKKLDHLVQFDLLIEVNESRYISKEFKEGIIMKTTAFDPG
ncbi:hypothetical protein [Aquimarina sp. AU58]|uniref:hypothetical protein n=1 Tax=Aquimarina sp. AU58 TaxID=1874112 RepID=UPI000D6E769F|nr:hypothetical protein [Aquimarina sp. AU58]